MSREENGSWWNDTLSTAQLWNSTSGLSEDSVSLEPSTQETTTLSPALIFWTQAADWTYKIGSPIIFLCGTTGNILTLLVLRRMRSDSSSFVLFFTALAVSDLSLIYVGLLPVWIDYQFHYSLQNTYQVFCKLFFFLFYSFGAVSAWLLSAMTIQRAVSVVWPHKVRSSCTKRQAYITIAAIVLTVAAIESHLLFFVEIHPQAQICYFSDSVLLLSNCVLIWSVVRSVQQARQRLSAGAGQTGRTGPLAAREKKLSSMTVTLMAVSAAFIILTGPVVFASLYTFYLGEAGPDHATEYPHNSFVAAVTNLLWYINSSINFLLYILTGSRFRQEFKAMLGLADKQSGTDANPRNRGGDTKATEATSKSGGGHKRESDQGTKSSEEF